MIKGFSLWFTLYLNGSSVTGIDRELKGCGSLQRRCVTFRSGIDFAIGLND